MWHSSPRPKFLTSSAIDYWRAAPLLGVGIEFAASFDDGGSQQIFAAGTAPHRYGMAEPKTVDLSRASASSPE
jgi:hypothetical protein